MQEIIAQKNIYYFFSISKAFLSTTIYTDISNYHPRDCP